MINEFYQQTTATFSPTNKQQYKTVSGVQQTRINSANNTCDCLCHELPIETQLEETKTNENQVVASSNHLLKQDDNQELLNHNEEAKDEG